MPIDEVRANINSRRDRIFLLMEELRRLRIQQRLKVGLGTCAHSAEQRTCMYTVQCSACSAIVQSCACVRASCRAVCSVHAHAQG